MSGAAWARLSRWVEPIRRPGRVLAVLAFTACAILVLPVLAIAVLALTSVSGVWHHVLTTTLLHPVALGAIDGGWQRLSPNLDAAARSLGASPMRMLASVHLPLLRPAVGAAALLVFVDAMKELPATILLRPFNFETLATQIYTYASQEQFNRSALAALTIIVVGLIPLMLLHRILMGSRSERQHGAAFEAGNRDRPPEPEKCP